MLAFDGVLGAPEKFVYREGLARGRSVGEKKLVKVIESLAATNLTQREVTLSARCSGLHHGAHDSACGRDDCKSDERDGRTIPAHELRRTIGDGIGSCADRLAPQEVAKVMCQGSYRLVALAGVFL